MIKNSVIGTRLWRGALRDAVWLESPNLYKVNGYYYLLISEEGTGHNHPVSIAGSESITEAYVENMWNPIFTHRHLGMDYPIVNVGHCDLAETQNGGRWDPHHLFMVVIIETPGI